MRPLLPSSVLLAGCVSGSGVLAERTVPVGSFAEVRNAGPVDLVIEAAPPGDGLLVCDANLLDRVDLEVDGEELVLSVSPGVVSVHDDCALHVTTDALHAVELQGSGDVSSAGPFVEFRRVRSSGSGRLSLSDLWGTRIDVAAEGSGSVSLTGLEADTVDVRAEGSGSVRLSGIADVLTVHAEGSGAVNLSDLLVREARIDATGSGVVSVRVTERAEIRLSGSGDVVVYGGAELYVVDDGSGDVLER